MKELRDEEGKTIFFISHSLPQVLDFCKTGMWIEGGQLKELGPIEEVAKDYSAYVDEINALKGKKKKAFLEKKFESRVLPPEKKKSFLKKIFH